MIDKQYLLSRLSGFTGSKLILKKDQEVKDIIGAMMQAHKIYASDYDKISGAFYYPSGKKIALTIFNFLKNNVKYKIEPDSEQRIMSPAAILTLSANDCKNYALFVGGILDSLKRQGKLKGNVIYRFASYKLLDEIPHHVFCVYELNGTEYWIDPVLPDFNNRKQYFHKLDRNTMALYSVSGIGQTKRQAKKAAKAAAPAEPKKKKRIVVKIALAPARTPFLLLVGLNFAGLATKLKAAIDRDANKTKNWWEGLGGNMNALLKKVEQGAKKKRILGIGAAPAAAPVAVAAAAPILIKLAEFLKSIGIDPQELAAAGKQIVANKVKQAVNQQIQKSDRAAQKQDELKEEIVNDAQNASQGTGSGTNYLPLLLVGGGILLFMSKSK